MNKKTLREIFDSTEAADIIAVESMKWHLNALTEQNRRLFDMGKLTDVRRDEIIENEKLKDALRLILAMYGENQTDVQITSNKDGTHSDNMW